MGVYIKGMEMPTCCEDCPMCHSNAEYDYAYCCVSSAETSGNKIPSDCPLVPVPDHGRRVVYRGDVYNAIEEKRIKTLDRVLNDRYIDGMHDGLKQALFALATVEDAPTIIPASEEGE